VSHSVQTMAYLDAFLCPPRIACCQFHQSRRWSNACTNERVRRPPERLDRAPPTVAARPSPAGKRRPVPPLASTGAQEAAHARVARAHAMLLALQHRPAPLPPEVTALLASIAPWSKRTSRQLDALYLAAASGVLPRRGMRVLLLRALQHARAVALAADESAGARAERTAQDVHQQRLSRLRATAAQYARVRRVGTIPNVHWRAVDRDVLRAHVSWENLPLPGSLTIKTARDLRFLRQDCEAWFASRSLVQLNASTLWMALGFGEQRAARRLGLSSASGMRSHHHALRAFHQMTDPSPYAALRRKEDEQDTVKQVYIRFGSLHEAGAMLAYLTWENGGGAAGGKRPFAETVRIQEAGLYILEPDDLPDEFDVDYNDVPVIAASPDGIVRRRRGDAFGAWEVQGGEVVEVKCRVPFVPLDGGKKWLFRLASPRRGVTASIYAQVQFQMLCAGRHVRRATVVSYAVLGGMTVTGVDRNDAWLIGALRVLADFQQEFVWAGRPPCEDFFADRPRYAAFVELTRDSMHAVEHVANIGVHEIDACLLPRDTEQQRRHDWWRSDIFVRDAAGG
jgi:hypothetical protein